MVEVRRSVVVPVCARAVPPRHSGWLAMKVRSILPLVMLLNACVPASQPEVATRATIAQSTLPPMKTFASVVPPSQSWSNRDLAADFIELSFQMESGRQLPVMTRFETPITVGVTGAPPPTLGPDLASLIRRLRSEAGIDIRQVPRGPAHITIEAVSRAEIQRVLPQAACFVAPNVSSLSEYRAKRRQSVTSWARLERREKLAIFLPNDVSPQEVRDCLHEELAQAIGPLNDLYRLSDSVFNDDNVHTVLTRFDMLILRAYYDPALRSGMTRAEAAARLPAIFARINPAGLAVPSRPAAVTPQAWNTAIQTALVRGPSKGRRIDAAQDALRIATRQGWQDNRRAFSHYAMGRALQTADPHAAHRHYSAADQYYARTPATRLHRAYIATQLAAFAVTSGEGASALRLIEPHLQPAFDSQNAALLATLKLLQAEALELEGRIDEARSVRLDSIGWARYGFGPDWAVRAKLREIASLNPLKG